VIRVLRAIFEVEDSSALSVTTLTCALLAMNLEHLPAITQIHTAQVMLCSVY